MPLEPTSAQQIADAVRAHSRVLAVGAQTKPRLSAVGSDVTILSTRRLTGITEYDPAEFTFTALAGTPMHEIVAALGAQGQYLPFDPVLVEAGATLGGTIASGLNGPGLLSYGAIRDFILAVQFVDGRGQILRGGAKVVKNAAGFDFPKFLVGSLGRFGMIAEATFKVFPQPVAWSTVCAPTPQSELQARLAEAARGRWEIDALSYDVHEGLLYARIGGPPDSNAALADELTRLWPRAFALDPQRAKAWWRSENEFLWTQTRDVLMKVPIALNEIPAIFALPSDCRAHIAGAANCAWVALPAQSFAETQRALTSAGLVGLVIRGTDVPLFTSELRSSETERLVRTVFDPAGRFPELKVEGLGLPPRA
jgi:glycolate oxidase FAD binding subunit